MIADKINGIFEAGGAAFLTLNIRRLLKDKKVEGVSWIPVAFWTLWGVWNLYYYPALGQVWSFVGGLFVVGQNGLWLSLVWYFARRRK